MSKRFPLGFSAVILAVWGSADLASAQSDTTPSMHPKVKIETTMGSIVLELDAEKAPVTVLNFVDYVEAKFYDGTVFHRVVPTVIQGGAYLPDMTEKKGGLKQPILCESYNGVRNDAGAVAMYRVPGNLKSARAQFFINVQRNERLDRIMDGGGYAVFGRVYEGMNVVEKIRDVKVDVHPKYAAGKNPVVPVIPVGIQTVRMLTPLDRPATESLAKLAAMPEEARLAAIIQRFEAQTGNKVVESTTGLKTIDQVVGKGAFPTVEEAVEINYSGKLTNGREFDSSQEKNQGPVSANVSEVLAGIREGILGMREGGKRIMILPPVLAFGEEGMPGKVPPDSTLIYEIELLGVKPPLPKREVIKVDEPQP